MPKATTTAEKATGYATTTREQSIAMSVRSFEKYEPSAGSAINSTLRSLVGNWVYSASAGNVGLSILIEFKSDGTFSKGIGTVTSFSVDGTSYNGNYKVDGDKIIYYNRLKGTAIASSLDEWFEYYASMINDIPTDDTTETFKLIDQNTLQLFEIVFTRVN